MCSACALTAMAGATGARAWLAVYVPALATPARLRAVTIVLLSAGVLLGSVSLRGSAEPQQGSRMVPAIVSAYAPSVGALGDGVTGLVNGSS